MPHSPANPVGAALPCARGGVLQRRVSERQLPCALPTHLSAAQLVLRRMNKGRTGREGQAAAGRVRGAENKTNGSFGRESFKPRRRRGTAARLPPDGAAPAPAEPNVPGVSTACRSRATGAWPAGPEPSRGKLTYSSWVGRL